MGPTSVSSQRVARLPSRVTASRLTASPAASRTLAPDRFTPSAERPPASVALGSPTPFARPLPPQPTLKDRIQENRERLGRVVVAQKQAGNDPAGRAAWRQEAEAYLEWLKVVEVTPTTPATSDDLLDAWMGKAADQVIQARGLDTPAARLGEYAQRFADYHAAPTRAARALLAAATAGALPQAPLPLQATSREIQAQLAPALIVLSASRSPLARELAGKIRQGDVSLEMVSGQALGTQFYAVVNTSRIKLSNGEKGPDFFRLSPPYQAATLLHEYTHVKQKEHVGGFVDGLKGNLHQRAVSLSGRLGGDAERLDAKGRALNENEQAAYRAEKAFLVEMGMGQKGVTPEDAGALVGIDSWLEAGR